MGATRKDFLLPQMIDYRSLHYGYDDPIINRLFEARARLITKSVKIIIKAFRKRKLKIGLDVFAPALAYLVGQDIVKLARFVDFIKPMMYNVTDAPAGIPFETNHLKIQLRKNGCNMTDELESFWGGDELADNVSFKHQLAVLGTLPCAIYPGIEVNKVAICATSKEYVENCIAIITEAGLKGCVLSWNVLEETVYP